MRLENMVALVTGGGSGIGAATARRFASEGAAVVVTGRRPEPLEQLAADTGILAVPGDATAAADVRHAVASAVERFGGLDVVVANAGGTGTPAAADTDDASWRAALDSNLTSAFLAAREALPALIERGGGSIVIVASEAALVAPPGLAGYVASKTALLGLMRSLAVDYGSRRVRANAVCPGWVRTPMADAEMDALARRRGLSREQAYELACSRLPWGRSAEPDEGANVCLFLASRESSFVTGAVLVADGGATAVDVGTLAFRPD
jgi:meso-butanediol dehydrogenase / (S,S)-butanediol dehydrogenase / diacetyl reductase